MANHKKKRPANRRAHCKLCKYWKINGICRESAEFEKFADHKRRIFAKLDAENYSEEIDNGEEY